MRRLRSLSARSERLLRLSELPRSAFYAQAIDHCPDEYVEIHARQPWRPLRGLGATPAERPRLRRRDQPSDRRRGSPCGTTMAASASWPLSGMRSIAQNRTDGNMVRPDAYASAVRPAA